MTKKAQFPSYDFGLPPGRFIAGSLTEKQTKDMHGKPRDHPTIWFAVAVPKTAPGVDQVLAIIYNCGLNDYRQAPANVQAQIKLWLGATAFAWKIHDGDTAEKWKNREGANGCWIFSFGTTFDIRCCDQNSVQMDPALIGLGDYIDVFASCSINGNTDGTAGVYLNPKGVRFVGYGQRITVGPSFQEMFANRPVQLPPGASATPVAAGPAGGMTSAPGTLPPPAGYPTPGQPAQHAAPQAPAHNGQMSPPPSASYPPAAGQPVMHTPPGGGVPGASPSSPQPGFAQHPTPPGASVPGVPAGATPAPAAPGTGQPGSQQTAYPSNVQPHNGFVNGPAAPPAPPPPAAQPTPEQIAAQYGVPHYAGYRYNPQTNTYDAA
jgi:hypothetical protein